MIKKENRLKKRKQFAYLFKNGSHKGDEFIGLVYLPLKTKNFKVGYSVSKKVGKAVVRNKVKRRLKECVLSFSNLIKNEFYIIVVAKPQIVNLKFDEMKTKLKTLFDKAGLINGSN
ncbi:MAG: ribonuclease P protein component [Christensenellales bacterium]